ncbi:MAG TPA: hypothetical protein VFL13_03635 [Candidatus Baltobacteraceae bacterium]|nr:hypothetical protein [Candidatus Baltobacteraceae bacterium]
MNKREAVVGVSDHGGWAIFVTVARDGTLLDRRRVELVDDALPAIPHHHEAQMLPAGEGVALVERVRASAEEHAAAALDELASAFPDVTGVALRERPPLPPTIEERIKDVRARNVADWVMYRDALAKAAEGRGWSVHWFDAKKAQAAAEPAALDLRKTVGPPWTADHKLVMAGALGCIDKVRYSP